MKLLVAVDYNRRVVKFSQSNNVYYSVRSLVNRDKFSSDCIYQADSISPESINIMFAQLMQHRNRRNDWDYGKLYKLDSYRVRSYCKVIGVDIPYFDLDEEYDLLTCKACGELFQAVYENISDIYRLNEIIVSESYCSDKCKRLKYNDCIVCGRSIGANLTTCSAKCEVALKLQKNKLRDTPIKRDRYNTDLYYCKYCNGRITNKSKDYCSMDCRIEHKKT